MANPRDLLADIDAKRKRREEVDRLREQAEQEFNEAIARALTGRAGVTAICYEAGLGAAAVYERGRRGGWRSEGETDQPAEGDDQ